MNQKMNVLNPFGKKAWSWTGLFLIALIVTLPVAEASNFVQITKNSGQASLNQFLDAQGDTWTVEAVINGADNTTIDPQQVKIKIGQNEAPFNSCTDGALGPTCQYLSPLTDGVKEGEFNFQVIYHYLNEIGQNFTSSAGDVVRTDGSAPEVNSFTAVQDNQGKVILDFQVTDKVKPEAPAVGLKQIDILDADSGAVLQTITDFKEGQADYDYKTDGSFDGQLQAKLEGEGKRKLKLRVEDRLGHQRLGPAVVIDTDFVAPQIKPETLNFTSLGKFIGNFEVSSGLSIDVVESHLDKVQAYSGVMALSGDVANCISDSEVEKLWHCSWKKVAINQPGSTLDLKIVASDKYGNALEEDLAKSFVLDSNAPTIIYFGTERLFEDKSYFKSGDNRLLLKVDDPGAGITEAGIRANLGALGKSTSEAPTFCNQSGTVLECYWDVHHDFSSDGAVLLGLSSLKDQVGNEGPLPSLEAIVDTTSPKVEELEFYGSSEAGDKDYFQSNDHLKIKALISESSGLLLAVNLKGLVADAETKFPATELTRDLGAGWQTFTEQNCQRTEGGKWECILETELLKSGPAYHLKLELNVRDTAGNEAESWPETAKNMDTFGSGKGLYLFDLLGLSTETNPDYWEVARVSPFGGPNTFVDLDTTLLTYARIPFQIQLAPLNENALAVSTELLGCSLPDQAAGASGAENNASVTPSAPQLSRSLLYGGVSTEGESSPVLQIVLEFAPFSGREMFKVGESTESFTTKTVEYLCQFKIYSKVKDTAIQSAEMQEVRVGVPFGFSTLGAQDENLDAIIKKEKEAASTGFWGTIGVLNKVVHYLDYAVQTVQIVRQAIVLFNVASKGVDEVAKAVPPAEPAAVGFCFGVNTFESAMAKVLPDLIEIPVGILSCNEATSLGPLDAWRSGILGNYNKLMNIELLHSPDSPCTGGACPFKPVRSVKENLGLSIASFCVTGLISNLDKYRQIKCRKVACLQNEVKSGLATVSMCNELEGLLTCKYFFGELWYILPFSQLYDSAINTLRNAFKDPIATVHTGVILTCGINCLAGDGGLSWTCKRAYYFFEWMDFIENVAGTVTTIVQDVKAGGLQYCDSVL